MHTFILWRASVSNMIGVIWELLTGERIQQNIQNQVLAWWLVLWCWAEPARVRIPSVAVIRWRGELNRLSSIAAIRWRVSSYLTSVNPREGPFPRWSTNIQKEIIYKNHIAEALCIHAPILSPQIYFNIRHTEIGILPFCGGGLFHTLDFFCSFQSWKIWWQQHTYKLVK
jgi:hypothetical protein